MSRTMQTAAQLRSALAERVLVADGAMGTMLQAADLTLDDFEGLEGCNEVLNVTRPDVVRGVHDAYFEAGADCVETNTFGANLANLAEYDIADRIRELAEAGRRIAREVADAGQHAGAAPLRARVGGARHQAADARPRAFADAARRVRGAGARPDRRRGRCCSSRPARTCCRSRPQWSGPERAMAELGSEVPVSAGHGGDHRHDAGRQRDRRGADRAGAARAST